MGAHHRSQAQIIISSKDLLVTLGRTAAKAIKSDGTDNTHKLVDIGDIRDDKYEENLKVAKPTRKMGKIPDNLEDPQWKQKWEMAQLQIKVITEEKKADAELFQLLAKR